MINPDEAEFERLQLPIAKVIISVLHAAKNDGKINEMEYVSIHLRYLEGQKPAAIANRQGWNTDRVYRALEDGKRKLKKYFKGLKLTPTLLGSFREQGILTEEEYTCVLLQQFEKLSWMKLQPNSIWKLAKPASF